MAYKVCYTSTVPNRSVMHFMNTEYGQLVARRAQSLIFSAGEKLLYYNTQFADCTHTTEIIFDCEESYKDIMSQIYAEFPDYAEKKAQYIAENNLIMERNAYEV